MIGQRIRMKAAAALIAGGLRDVPHVVFNRRGDRK
jgi:hypothetical protein